MRATALGLREKQGILLHLNEFTRGGNRKLPHSKQLGEDGPRFHVTERVRKQTRDPKPREFPAPSPGESCRETKPPGKHRSKGPRTTKGGGSVRAGRAARARGLRRARARRMAGPRLQRLCRPGLTHQLMVPNLALPPGSSAETGSSGITSGFSQSPGSDVHSALCARKRRGWAGPGALTLPRRWASRAVARVLDLMLCLRTGSACGGGVGTPRVRFLPEILTCKILISLLHVPLNLVTALVFLSVKKFLIQRQ